MDREEYVKASKFRVHHRGYEVSIGNVGEWITYPRVNIPDTVDWRDPDTAVPLIESAINQAIGFDRPVRWS
jgi:hypothetical protein